MLYFQLEYPSNLFCLKKYNSLLDIVYTYTYKERKSKIILTDNISLTSHSLKDIFYFLSFSFKNIFEKDYVTFSPSFLFSSPTKLLFFFHVPSNLYPHFLYCCYTPHAHTHTHNEYMCMDVCMFMRKYMQISLTELVIVSVCMFSKQTTLHWTIDKGTHPSEWLILLYPASLQLPVVLRPGVVYVNMAIDFATVLILFKFLGETFTADFLVF